MKIRKAVALRYDRDLPAPIITAKGRGYSAARILELAEKNGIAVVCNDNLSDSLYTFNVGDLITEEYYEIVAEILAFILKV
ncbi:MAG: EscU/YscU/HrcU family type III secretion system export apparatus switch protein [Spirochaetia bacterium]|jgi:type III secretion system FlhB-like substrate exporter|nr:EscU/YscU/HrcU family type III secretion system export apparatus switch protein [Spirochaetia bacterium]